MRKFFTFIFVACVTLVNAANFTPGNIVAVLSGDGTSTTNSVPVSLLEYNTTDANQASPVQTINLNSTTGSTMLTLGSNLGEGFINNSEDGKWLLLQGYDATTGLGTSVHRASPNKKSIVKIGNDGVPSYISLDYTNGSGQASRSVATVNGSAYWNLVGSKGIGYFTDQSASVPNASFTEPVIGTVGNFYRVIRIFKNKLYMMHNDILTYSNDNLPIAANSAVTTLTLANGGAGISCTGLQFFDLDANSDWNGTGYDVLYIADGNGGVRKMSWVGSEWVLNQKYNYLGVAPWGYMGMAARLEGGKPTMYLAQSSNNALYANQIQKIVDNNGYNTVISPVVTIIATAPANKSFRSIGFAPEANITTNNIQFNSSSSKVFASTSGITIQAANKQAYKIVNTLGQTLAQGNVTSDNQLVAVNAKGLLFVQLSKQVIKVIL